MNLLVIAAVAAAAQPWKLHTYKDWIVGCDNVRVCQANALEVPPGGDDFLAITVSRGALPTDRATLSVPLPDGAAIGQRFSLKVDAATVVTFPVRSKDSASLPLSGGLLAALRKGQHATLLDASGKKAGEASLAGLAAAMRYVDDQQGRVGTIGALVATGPKLDATVPAPPASPLIVTPAASSKPPRTVSVTVATRLIGPDNATCDYANAKVEPRAYRLDAAHSLVLIDHPCGNSAYNYFPSVYVLDEAGSARPASFDQPDGMGESFAADTGDLTNGDWDPKTRRLSSYEKGRGFGDCGLNQIYAWDGERFRLLEQAEMGECRGSIHFIRTWTARANR